MTAAGEYRINVSGPIAASSLLFKIDSGTNPYNADASTGERDGMRACPANGRDVFAGFNGIAVYKDFVQSFATIEPGIDLTASSPLAFAWQMADGPSGIP